MAARANGPALAFFVIALLAVSAAAHEVGSPYAEWFESLRVPDYPATSCCGEADQYWADTYVEVDDGLRVLAYRTRADGSLDTRTVVVPLSKVDWNRNNPTGKIVVFIGGTGMPYCLVPANGA